MTGIVVDVQAMMVAWLFSSWNVNDPHLLSTRTCCTMWRSVTCANWTLIHQRMLPWCNCEGITAYTGALKYTCSIRACLL